MLGPALAVERCATYSGGWQQPRAALLLVPVLAAGRVRRSWSRWPAGCAAVYRWLARLLGRWVGPRAARAVGWVAVVGLTIALVSGVLLDGLVVRRRRGRSRSATGDHENPRARSSPLSAPSFQRAPDPWSLWDSLGREGRKFAGLGPTASGHLRLHRWVGARGADPGVRGPGVGTSDPEDRANLAVADLERAGGFDRKYLSRRRRARAVAGSTRRAIDTVKYMTGGDSAIVAIQYSYLPSWISYLVDQGKRAREAGRALFDAVYSKWSALPQDREPAPVAGLRREPRLVGGGDRVQRRAGPAQPQHPARSSPDHRTSTRSSASSHDSRDSGSPEVAAGLPNGRTVRFDDHPGPPIEPASVAWDGPRMLYLQADMDPIVWWTPRAVC